MPDQVYLNTHKVSLTDRPYDPSEATEKVKNIATLMDITMDEDFRERYLNDTRGISFYISPKAIPRELINALESTKDGSVFFRINYEKRTLNPLPESQYDRLSFDERGIMYRDILEVIRIGGLLYIGFDSTGLWVNYSIYSGDEGPRPVAFVESTY